MKMLKIAFFVCISAINGLAQSQPARISGQERIADSLKDEGDIPGAIAVYRKIYLINPKDYKNTYNYARALSVGKMKDSCFRYLNIVVKMDTSLAALIEPDFITARKDKRWQKFEDDLISMLNIKYKKPFNDIEYAKKLWKLRAFDQAYFTQVGIAGKKIGMKSSVVEALWDFKFMIQERNQEELGKLIDEKGWPKIKDVGEEAAMASYLIVMHSNDGLQKKYLSVIKQCCEENELSWQRYAAIYDRALYNENKPQKYGTHTRYNEKTGKEELYPLENEEKVNEWRKEIGLQPIEEYLKQFNIQYHPNISK
jgi:hypothetical protein